MNNTLQIRAQVYINHVYHGRFRTWKKIIETQPAWLKKWLVQRNAQGGHFYCHARISRVGDAEWKVDHAGAKGGQAVPWITEAMGFKMVAWMISAFQNQCIYVYIHIYIYLSIWIVTTKWPFQRGNRSLRQRPGRRWWWQWARCKERRLTLLLVVFLFIFGHPCIYIYISFGRGIVWAWLPKIEEPMLQYPTDCLGGSAAAATGRPLTQSFAMASHLDEFAWWAQ